MKLEIQAVCLIFVFDYQLIKNNRQRPCYVDQLASERACVCAYIRYDTIVGLAWPGLLDSRD